MEQIIEYREGAYLVPSYSIQTVFNLPVPRIITNSFISPNEMIDVYTENQDSGPLEKELSGYSKESREKIFRGLQQVGCIDFGTFRNEIEPSVDSI